MKFSYNWLQSYLNKQLPPVKELVDFLNLHVFETEEPVKDKRDWLLEIDITPNRPDCSSHYGMAREIGALLNLKLKGLTVKPIKKVKTNLKPIKLELRAKDLVPRYSALVITDIKIGSSPKWIQERLISAGARPINNIVDLTNYVMLETGQPLHAFDYDKILNQEMILRKSFKKEKVITLDGIERELDEGMLVFQNKANLIDLVGIMGGALSQVSSGTKAIVLQAGVFDKKNIYQTTKKLGHSTEASAIYTQGLDPNLANLSLERCLALLAEMGGGQVSQIIDIYPKKVKPHKIRLAENKVSSLLGLKISSTQIKNILTNLNFEVKKVSDFFEVTVPTYRADLRIAEDLIEEIGRIYGYDKIEPSLPAATIIPPARNENLIYSNKIKQLFAGLGFTEVYNYSFFSNKLMEACPFKAIELENPVSQEQKYLRTCLGPNLIINFKNNLRYFDQINLFEIGHVFNLEENKVKENIRLAGLVGSKGDQKDSQQFYVLKGFLDSIFQKIGITDTWYDDQIEDQVELLNLFHPTKRAEIKIGSDLIGWLGEISFDVLNKLDLRTKATIFEIDLEKLIQLASEERIYSAPSKYPALVRDISVLVEPTTKVVQVLNLINATGGALVADVDLFDMYEGDNLPEGKKNFAFHIIYQSDQRTLTEKEVDQLHQKIIQTLEQEGGWEVRK